MTGTLGQDALDAMGICVECGHVLPAHLATCSQRDTSQSSGSASSWQGQGNSKDGKWKGKGDGKGKAPQGKGGSPKGKTPWMQGKRQGWYNREGEWVGLSGRVRVVVYNTEMVDPVELPASILDFVDSRWESRIGWAPQNGSFQAWVTALRVTEGEDAARTWLEDVRDNGAVEYPNNTSIVQAAANGEIEVGFVNHYYLHRFLAEEGGGFGARNHYTAAGDVGTLVNVAGAGILASSSNSGIAERLLEFLLGEEALRPGRTRRGCGVHRRRRSPCTFA